MHSGRISTVVTQFEVPWLGGYSWSDASKLATARKCSYVFRGSSRVTTCHPAMCWTAAAHQQFLSQIPGTGVVRKECMVA